MGENGGFSLLSLDGVGEAAKLLIEKIANAVGWLATRDTPKKMALNAYIEDIKKSNYDPIIKASLISNAAKTIKEYSCQREILNHALKNMKDTAKPNEVDDDWIIQFMDKASRVSNAEFQLIWGKVLSEECNKPGTMPRRLLHILEQMDKKDAELFTRICSFTVHYYQNEIIGYLPIIPISMRVSSVDTREQNRSFFREKGLDYSAIKHLTSIGLVENDLYGITGGYHVEFITPPPNTIYYFENSITFPAEIIRVPTSNVALTRAGIALCHAIQAEEQIDFWEKICLPLWDEKSLREYNSPERIPT